MRNGRMKIAMLAAVLTATAHLTASGPLGIYGIIEKVVFEPNEQAPQRIQVWGAFAYVDGTAGESLSISPAARGYLYFRLAADGDGPVTSDQLQAIKREWADLKSVAGTGQAIGFGHWGYIGAFGGLRPDARGNMPPYILERAPGNPQTDRLHARGSSRWGAVRRARSGAMTSRNIGPPIAAPRSSGTRRLPRVSRQRLSSGGEVAASVGSDDRATCFDRTLTCAPACRHVSAGPPARSCSRSFRIRVPFHRRTSSTRHPPA